MRNEAGDGDGDARVFVSTVSLALKQSTKQVNLGAVAEYDALIIKFVTVVIFGVQIFR